MAPPAMKHLYLDNFWKDIGNELGSLVYRDDVIIEHMHPFAGKSESDEGYVEVNSSELYKHDQKAFQIYSETEMSEDLDRLRLN